MVVLLAVPPDRIGPNPPATPSCETQYRTNSAAMRRGR